MLHTARLHVDTDLPSRLQLILAEYDYIVRDEDSVAAALQKIHNYAAKTEADTWEELVERLCFQCSLNGSINAFDIRSEYKDVALACRDVSTLLSSMPAENKLDGFHFFIAPKIDFRQACLPNFLLDENMEC